MDAALIARLATMRATVSPAAADYSARASAGTLYTIAPRKIPLKDPAVGGATRKDLKDLYERFMVNHKKAGRPHYEQILLSAPFERCPYCGLGRATTLDHYLPKSRYPQFSVTPDNLVPACKDCQGKKGRHVALSGAAQTLHPYFDSQDFFSTRWILGRVNRTHPISVAFYPAPPSSWRAEDRQRARAHFVGHNLGERFSVEAATELAVLKDFLKGYRDAGDFGSLHSELGRWAKSYERLAANCWQSALYHTLSNDHWFCTSPHV